MTNHSKSLEVDTIIDGTYRVLDFLGEGGMGGVYKVEHSQLNKILALKILKTNQLSEAVWQRFRNEAKAIARLEHRNIVKIYDMNQTDSGRPYYTMDFLIGESLAEHLNGNKSLSLSQALHIFRQVCSGLAYAHSRGIIHRDIKPANIMLLGNASAEQLQVKIVDFGIAKLLDDDGHTIQGVTRPGEVFGSPLYMSPEQCTGSKLDGRSDMYSVAVTMFKALTGNTPFRGRTAIETTMMHQSDAPPLLNSVSPDLQYPTKLERIIDKMLSKLPEERYQSLAEVENELQKIQIKIGKASPVVSSIDQALINQEEHDSAELTEQIDTISATGEGTIQQKSHNLNWSLIALCACIAIVLASALMLETARIMTARKIKPIGPAARLNSPLDDYNKMDPYDSIVTNAVGQKGQDRTDPLDENKSPAIQMFLKRKFTPFSQQLPLQNGTSQLKFEFPQEFSLGVIECTQAKDLSNNSNAKISAQGQILVPPGTAVRFEPADVIGDYPRLLTYFQPNDLQALRIPATASRSDELISNIARLQGLNDLELANCKLEARDLKTLEPLKNLRTLNLSRCNLGGHALASSALLSQIAHLNIEAVKNIGPVIHGLNPNIFGLVLNQCQCTTTDLEKVAKLPHLRALYLNGCKITDKELNCLGSVKELAVLDLDGCDRLTRDSLVTIKNIKTLQFLKLPAQLDTQEFHLILRSHQPLLKFDLP
jgi:serine/threonine protein kinase